MTLLLVLLVIVPWSIYRQMQVHAVTSDGLVKLPLIFIIIGIIGGATRGIPTDAEALGYLLISFLLSVGFGVWRGFVIPVWRGDDGNWMSQGNTLTLMLWVALFATKIAMGVIGSVTDIFPGEHAGEIFMAIGISFAVQNFIVANRTIWNNDAAAPAARPTA
jgi:hypothetical protein